VLEIVSQKQGPTSRCRPLDDPGLRVGGDISVLKIGRLYS
jgi:hypothetical protein